MNATQYKYLKEINNVLYLNNEGQIHYAALAVKDYLDQNEVLDEEKTVFYYKAEKYFVRASIIVNQSQQWDAVCELVPFADY
jgi:hypothetical protein